MQSVLPHRIAIYPITAGYVDHTAPLDRMSIGELERFYRQSHIRHKERLADGREHFTYYIEGRIVREIKSRKAASNGEKLKVDYCVATYRNELENMSAIFSRPVKIDDDKIFPDNTKMYTPEELTSLIALYRDYRDITDREILIEYVDYALDLLKSSGDARSMLGLVTEIAEIGRRKIIHVPAWVDKMLEDAVAQQTDNDAELAIPLLTLHLASGNRAFERKAQRIINRCYKSALNETLGLSQLIDNLHTAVTCCEYVTRFSVRKTAAIWNRISDCNMSTEDTLTSKQIFQLLEIAHELEGYAHISRESKNHLKELLGQRASSGDIEAFAYSQFIKLRF